MSTILFTIQHPADVHLFRHSISELRESGHDVYVFAREKDIATKLLERYGIDHEVLSVHDSGLFGTIKMQLSYELKLFRRARQIQPDVMCADGIAVGHLASILDSRGILFTDTEHVVGGLVDKRSVVYRFADEVHTPKSYWLELGENQKRYPSFHELAYLHPNRFKPDPSVCERISVDKGDKLAIFRLVSWDAFHDRGQKGISNIDEIITHLEQAGMEIILSSESGPPEKYSHLSYDLPVEEIHHLMYEADLFVGESATMAAECAMMGTPSVYISSLRTGYLSELEHKYDLVRSFSPNEQKFVIEGIKEILDQNSEYWQQQKEEILTDKIDMTGYITDQIERSL